MTISTKKDKNFYFVCIIIFILLKFFSIYYLRDNIFNYPLTYFLLFFFFTYRTKTTYSNKINTYIYLVILSCLYSSLTRGQELFKILVSGFNYIGLISFYILAHFKLTYSQSKKILSTISISFCLCYLLQWAMYPTIVFAGASDTINVNTDLFRLRMPASISAFYLVYNSLSDFLRFKKIKSLILFSLGILPIILMGFRTLTILTLLECLGIIVASSTSIKKSLGWVILTGIFLGASTQIPIVQDKIQEMQERQEAGDTFQNQDYIRYIEYDFYNNMFSNIDDKLLGGGPIVYDNKTQYSKNMKAAEDDFIFWADLGLVGLSFIIGIPAIIALLVIMISLIKKCKSLELQSIRFTIITATIGSLITTMELYREGNLIIIGMLLYTEYIYSKESSNLLH